MSYKVSMKKIELLQIASQTHPNH